jgi:hypothetical protein
MLCCPRWKRSALLLCSFVTLAASNSATALQRGTIDTYVGGDLGDGAAAIDASIDPRGLVAIGAANAPDLYIADGKQNRVRRVDGRTGIIETIAGNGTAGYAGDGGQAQDAALALPLDVAFDTAGNLYISEYLNNRIRKVTPSGQISTFAGNGNLSYSGDGGLATQAALYNPWGIAVGPDGYVYIADSGNNRIRRVGPPGCGPQSCIITTAVGSGTWGFGGDGGPAASAVLRNPSDVAFDGAGNMLISDWGNQRIRRVVNGVINTIAGGGTLSGTGGVGDGGPAVNAVLRYPAQVTADGAGTVYITDTQQRRVRVVQNGIITTLAGTGTAGDDGDGGPAVNADMYLPYGVAVGQAGDVWIATTADLAYSQHNRVRHVDTSRIIEAAVGGGFGNGGAAANALVDPRGAVAMPGAGPLPDLYFADGNNNVVRYVDGRNATIYVIAGNGQAGYSGDGGPATSAMLRIPLDVAVDGNGNVYIADTSNNAVRRVDHNGVITTVAGTGQRGFTGDGGPAASAQLAAPNGVAVDATGNLYIADFNNNRVRKVGPNGVITTVAGNGTSGYGGDGGPATAASLRNPWDVVVASDGTMYIADTFNYRIRRVDPNGIISTYAGTGVSGFGGDGGLATLAEINTPSGLGLDNANQLFIADTNNERVRAVDAATGVINSVAGSGQPGVSGDGGLATAATFSPPSGVAIDPRGSTLFIAASDDARVRMVNMGGCAIVAQPQRSSLQLVLSLLAPLALVGALRRRASTTVTGGVESAARL